MIIVIVTFHDIVSTIDVINNLYVNFLLSVIYGFYKSIYQVNRNRIVTCIKYLFAFSITKQINECC